MKKYNVTSTDFKRLIPNVWKNQYFSLDITQRNESIIDDELLTVLTRSIEVNGNKIKWNMLLTDTSSEFIKILQNMTKDKVQSNISLNIKLLCSNSGNVIADICFTELYFDDIDLNGFSVDQEGGKVGYITFWMEFNKNYLK